jgi:hypothetical protein
MHGFPLSIPDIRQRMCGHKKKFMSENAAHLYMTRWWCATMRNVYLCPFCCCFHMTHCAKVTAKIIRERWLVIWAAEVEGIDIRTVSHEW